MTFGELIERMKNNLQPFNPAAADIVKMGIHSNYGYMEGKTVRAAIDCFQERSRTAYALGEKLNPLEQLGAMLLLESAYLKDLE
jgi:hypothetical protein